MIKYKLKLIEKVLKHDLQPTNNNAHKLTDKSRNDKGGKKCDTERVVVQR
jgi:hypothetical protein